MEIYFVEPESSLADAGEKELQKASEALPALGRALAQPMKEFWDGFASVGNEPNDVELTFKLLFEGKAGWAIVSTRGEASLTVKLKWSSGEAVG